MEVRYEAEFLIEFNADLLKTLNQIRREPLKFKFGKYRSTDAAASYLRSRMDVRFHTMPLDMIRECVHSNSSKLERRLDDKSRRKTVRDKVIATVRNSNRELSAEYRAYIDSPVWKDRASRHRSEVDWHCQVCGKQHGTVGTLEVHHNTYGNLDGNEPHWSIIAVCGDTCHPVCDFLRQNRVDDITPTLDGLFAFASGGEGNNCKCELTK